MNNRDLELLLRMASEIDGLESNQGLDRGDVRTTFGERAGASAAVATRCVSNPRAFSFRIRSAALLAAAAAIALLAFGLPGRHANERSGRREGAIASAAAASVPVRVCAIPTLRQPGRRAIERIQPTLDEPASLLALVRAWNSECSCMLWDLHVWDDGAVVTDMRAGEPVNIDLDGAPPAVEQVLVLAVDRNRNRLRDAASNTADLLNCLNSRPDGAAGGEPGVSGSTTVAACLPTGITLVSHPVGSPR